MQRLIKILIPMVERTVNSGLKQWIPVEGDTISLMESEHVRQTRHLRNSVSIPADLMHG